MEDFARKLARARIKPFCGRPHNDYYRNKALCDDIFAEFTEDMERGHLFSLATAGGVPPSTVYGWYDQWMENEEWRPYNGEVHGRHHRIFSDVEEAAVADFIRVNYIQQEYAFHDEDFVHLIMQAFLEKYRDQENIPPFQCSPRFKRAYKVRNGFSVRVTHGKRRPDTTVAQEQEWKSSIVNLLKSGADTVLNADETCWRILPNGMTTWANKGSDGVTVRIDDDSKAMITVMATITATGEKMPLFLIAHGKTRRVEASQLGDVFPNVACHTESGWMTQEAIGAYLQWIRSQSGHMRQIHMIWDVYSTHRTAETVAKAEALNIKLHFVPAGMTDRWQPLDFRVFGALKATAKKTIYRRMAEQPNERIGMNNAVAILIWSWNHLSSETLSEAWQPYMEGNEGV